MGYRPLDMKGGDAIFSPLLSHWGFLHNDGRITGFFDDENDGTVKEDPALDVRSDDYTIVLEGLDPEVLNASELAVNEDYDGNYCFGFHDCQTFVMHTLQEYIRRQRAKGKDDEANRVNDFLLDFYDYWEMEGKKKPSGVDAQPGTVQDIFNPDTGGIDNCGYVCSGWSAIGGHRRSFSRVGPGR